MKRGNHTPIIILLSLGAITIVWFALKIAPLTSLGVAGIISGISSAMSKPFSIAFCENSLRTVLAMLLIYSFAIALLFSSQRNYRKREEHGSAKWGKTKSINRHYRQRPEADNKILTQNVRIGINDKKHRRNLNTFVCGGSGSGKTRYYCKPNLMQANTSFVVLDPKGELLRDTGFLLKEKGYEIKVLDLIDMDKSHGYNPFDYIKSDNDVQKLVTNLFKATAPKNAQAQDPFWDNSASMLLSALIFYLHYEAPEEEQNFSTVMEMLRAMRIENDEEFVPTVIDMMFDNLAYHQPNHIAVKYYRNYLSGSPKTLKSIQISLASRLEKFNLDSVSKLTSVDELDMNSLGEKKMALFALLPDNDTSFNFLISILYTQLFQNLFYIADHLYGGRLPVPVHFLMDEFANVSLPNDFDKILSVMRSRGVFVSIILQNLAQLKSLFIKQWESIIGNCDEFIYLGGNEQGTHEYISKMLGKSTIDINTFGKSNGKSGNYTKNYQLLGRELLTLDEVRMLDNKKAILLIRGERPVLDQKYNLLKHPNVSLTADGDMPSYTHGGTRDAIASVVIDKDNKSKPSILDTDAVDTDYELITNEEVESMFNLI